MKKKIKVHSSFDTPQHHGHDCYDPESPVQQHLREEADINNIIAYWSRSGELPLSKNPVHSKANFCDCTVVDSYESALNVLYSAEQAFDSLPLEEQLKFQEDPILYMEDVVRNATKIKNDAKEPTSSESPEPQDKN